MPAPETVLQELSSATSMDDFFGKDGIFARLFAKTMESMLEAEMTLMAMMMARKKATARSSSSRLCSPDKGSCRHALA